MPEPELEVACTLATEAMSGERQRVVRGNEWSRGNEWCTKIGFASRSPERSTLKPLTIVSMSFTPKNRLRDKQRLVTRDLSSSSLLIVPLSSRSYLQATSKSSESSESISESSESSDSSDSTQ